MSFFLLFFSNILHLINAFDYPETSITIENYDQVLTSLNQTNPDIIQGLPLKTCDIQNLLSQVSGAFIFLYPVNSLIICPVWVSQKWFKIDSELERFALYRFRVWRERAWPSSFSQRPSSRCLFHLSGQSSFSSCSSVSAFQLCLGTLREWWFPFKTLEFFLKLGLKKFLLVTFSHWGLLHNHHGKLGMIVTACLCCFFRSYLLNILCSWAHIHPTLWELLASSFWQLCRLNPPPNHRFLWNVCSYLHLWDW